MTGLIGKIFRIITVAIVLPGVAFGAQARSSRSISSKILTRGQTNANTNAVIRRSATSVIARTTSANTRQTRKVVTARPAVSRAASAVPVRTENHLIKTGANVSRAAVSRNASKVRSATNKKVLKGTGHLSRAASSRATAVFNDMSKIGGGYASCRDSYATCMDQFCAIANDTYRRCFCSDKFANYRETADNLEKALGLLADFQNNNLNAVNKTAAEVKAMYSTTAGEEVIKKDTSSTQKLLDEIGDILSNKSSASNTKRQNTTSLNVLGFGDFSAMGDIWGDSDNLLFGGERTNTADLEGAALYQNANKQCMAITRDSCSGDAALNLASSAYSIMITQDCNAFEKSLETKRKGLTDTVRQAEQILREARLEEYRTHNSKDVNDCLAKVEEAFKNPMTCGENFEKCLDYTGKYINAVTGEPIYHELFNLTKIAPELPDDGDIVKANKEWNNFFENLHDRANAALDTCRDDKDIVWEEFKRMMIIKIAQAQDDKIESVKDSCVQTIKECYDSTDGTLKELASDIEDKKLDTSASRTLATRGMCYDKVMACAALYGGSDGCAYDRSTRKITTQPGSKCGLQSLLNYVDTVDSTHIAQGCEIAVSEYAHELCDPVVNTTDSTTADDTTLEYPMGCADMPRNELRAKLTEHAKIYCAYDDIKNDTANPNKDTSTLNIDAVNSVLKDIFDKLNISFSLGCEDVGGIWFDSYTQQDALKSQDDLNITFYNKYYGSSVSGVSTEAIQAAFEGDKKGACLNSSEELYCKRIIGTSTTSENQDRNRITKAKSPVLAKEANGKCDLQDAWYDNQCKKLTGKVLSNGVCEISISKQATTSTTTQTDAVESTTSKQSSASSSGTASS